MHIATASVLLLFIYTPLQLELYILSPVDAQEAWRALGAPFAPHIPRTPAKDSVGNRTSDRNAWGVCREYGRLRGNPPPSIRRFTENHKFLFEPPTCIASRPFG